MILAESRARFADLRKTAEGALAQVSDDEFFAPPEPSGETNSIALIVKHIAGNARSRWTDFLTSDARSRTAFVTPSSNASTAIRVRL